MRVYLIFYSKRFKPTLILNDRQCILFFTPTWNINMIYYFEITIQQENDWWLINEFRATNKKNEEYHNITMGFLDLCNYIGAFLYRKMYFSTKIDKNDFDENILNEIASYSEFDIFSSNIEDMVDMKNISFECDDNLIQIKISYKIYLHH